MANLEDGNPPDHDAGTTPVSDTKLSSKTSTRTDTASSADTSVMVKSAVDRALHFLSNASNETLGACLVGLGATTYLVLGRFGLILIGAVGGVVLHATWDGSSRDVGQDEDDREGKRRKETNSQIALRLLEWREAQKSKQLGEEDEAIASNSSGVLDYSGFEPETGKALEALTDAVIRDYVRWWYDPVRPAEDAFPSTCRRTFTSFVLGLSSNLSRKRPADTFLEFVTNSSSIVIVLLNELSAALSGSPSSSPSDAVATYLEMKPQSNLANILDEPQQRHKLEMVANDILENYLDAKVFNCPPARVFLREILAHIVLDMTLQKCCQSEWINEWIVYLLEEGEPELLNAIDAGVEESSVKEAIPSKVEEAAMNLRDVQKSQSSSDQADHKRNVSRAEEAMEEAMREAQRLTQLIAEEDAKRAKETSNAPVDDTSDSTNTHGIQTPASSQGDLGSDETQLSTLPVPSETNTAVGTTDGSVMLPDEESPPSNDVNHNAPSQPSTPLHEQREFIQEQPQETLTLHKANFTIFDDADPNDRRPMKAKPAIDYMVQIEPLSSNFRGWMIARTYADFETLHEVLRRISAISGAVGFAESHGQLPQWRGSTKAQLTQNLERYLTDAVQFEPLAESEGMKRFLEKSRGLSRSPAPKNVFTTGQAAIENMGKGMFDVLSKAPKGVAGGGKAVFGGVTSVLGGGQNSKKAVQSPTTPSSPDAPALNAPRASTSSIVSSSTSNVQSGSTSSLPRSSVYQEIQGQSTESATSLSDTNQPESTRNSASSTAAPVPVDQPDIPPRPETPQMNLPPRPSAIPDDYQTPANRALAQSLLEPTRTSIDQTPVLSGPSEPIAAAEMATIAPSTEPASNKGNSKKKSPMSSQETQVTIELLFAVINELYTLSSAWNIRRTLLNAAKTFLLRPGNPQLENIRVLLQESVLDANTSDAGMATHILKLRENTLPTEEELKAWPAPPGDEEKEALRKKARKLLVERGMPQALTSVMGAAASGEALGRVFDCLQVERVARGLMFGVMLQAVRAVTQ